MQCQHMASACLSSNPQFTATNVAAGLQDADQLTSAFLQEHAGGLLSASKVTQHHQHLVFAKAAQHTACRSMDCDKRTSGP